MPDDTDGRPWDASPFEWNELMRERAEFFQRSSPAYLRELWDYVSENYPDDKKLQDATMLAQIEFCRATKDFPNLEIGDC